MNQKKSSLFLVSHQIEMINSELTSQLIIQKIENLFQCPGRKIPLLNQKDNGQPIDLAVSLMSSSMHDQLFKKAYAQFEEESIRFFNPIVFANSILNSITAKINQKWNLRTYSNSFARGWIGLILNDFQYLPALHLLLIQAGTWGRENFLQLFFFSKENISGLKIKKQSIIDIIDINEHQIKKNTQNVDFLCYIGRSDFVINQIDNQIDNQMKNRIENQINNDCPPLKKFTAIKPGQSFSFSCNDPARQSCALLIENNRFLEILHF